MPKPPDSWTRADIDDHWHTDHRMVAEELMALKDARDPHVRLVAIVDRIHRHFGTLHRYDVEAVMGNFSWTLAMHERVRPLTNGLWLPGIKAMPPDIKAVTITPRRWPGVERKCRQAWQSCFPALFALRPLAPPLPTLPVLSQPSMPIREPKLQPFVRTGVVYILIAEGTPRIKIGRSSAAPIRLETLQTASPYPLRNLRFIQSKDAVRLETMLHRRYAKYRKHGEWFELPVEILEALLREDFS